LTRDECVRTALSVYLFFKQITPYGMLKQLGVTETIAGDKTDYVEKAVRLGVDPSWRMRIRERMEEGHCRLYSDPACVRYLEEFYGEAVAERSLARYRR